MRLIFLLTIYNLPLALISQEVIEGPWKLECGASTSRAFQKYSSFNIRYISPRFKYTNEDWTEEMEKHPDKYKRARFMIELLYTPPIKILCGGINLQYRLLKYKKLSLEVYGGLKFIFAAPTDFIANPNLTSVANKQGWYINTGLILQLDLGLVSPFADIGYDEIITIGTAFNFHAIYKQPKKRYKLHTRQG